MSRLPIRNTSRYAPIRYEATRPYAMRIGRRFAAAAKQGESVRLDFVRKELFPLVQEELSRLGAPPGPGPGQAEITNVQLFGPFQQDGRIIFDMHRLLTQALTVTDIKDVPCGALTFPAEHFYIHFGQESGITSDGLPVEGAFVTHLETPHRLIVDLIPAGFYANPYFWELPMGETPIGRSIDLSQPNLPVVTAMERSVAEVMENNRKMFQELEALERQLSEQYGQIVKVPTPMERLDDKMPMLRQALQMVVNTCFFLTATEDVHEGWELDAPADLRLQAEHAEKPGTRKTAENTLANSGYIKVRYVGQRYGATQAAQDLGEALSSGRVMPTHFRRGHVRHQPYGPERALRKIVFIPPVLVNPHRAGDSPGRVYDVQPPAGG